MIRGCITSQIRWDKNGYAKRASAVAAAGREGGTCWTVVAPRVRWIDLRCLLRAARRYEGLTSECENDEETERKSLGRLAREIIATRVDKGGTRFKAFLSYLRGDGKRSHRSQELRLQKEENDDRSKERFALRRSSKLEAYTIWRKIIRRGRPPIFRVLRGRDHRLCPAQKRKPSVELTTNGLNN